MSKLTTTRNGLAKAKRGKGPTGKLLCRCGCGREPQGRRTSFFDDECAEKFNLCTNPAYIAARLVRRDEGICAVCGMDCKELWQRLFDEGHGDRRIRYCWKTPEHQSFLEKLRNYSISWHEYTTRSRFWDADHIVPVVEGGGLCGLENYQTLCLACHKAKTAKMRAERAKQKVPKALEETGQLQLL